MLVRHNVFVNGNKIKLVNGETLFIYYELSIIAKQYEAMKMHQNVSKLNTPH